jgi:NADH:ubiquinone oxidoreductase subunit E
MGSSCFSRGNNRNIEVLQDFVQKRGLPVGVDVTGHLCEGLCNQGPNISIEGKTYHGVDPIVITGLLQHLRNPGPA